MEDRPIVSVVARGSEVIYRTGPLIRYDFVVNLDRVPETAGSIDWVATALDEPHAEGDRGTIAVEPGLPLIFESAVVFGAAFEAGATIALTGVSSGLVLGTSAATTIQGDGRSRLSIAPLAAEKAEGDGGTTELTFTVSLDRARATGESVGWSIDGFGHRAAAEQDFAGPRSGTLSFAAGETSRIVSVLVAGDLVAEFDETFRVSLTAPSPGLALEAASALGVIGNDDAGTPAIARDDLYIVRQGRSLTIAPAAGVLLNDQGASSAALVAGAAHGVLQLAAPGGFTYAPATGFAGVDTFVYRAAPGDGGAEATAQLLVVPLTVGASTTLNLLALGVEQRIAVLYVALLGRGADSDGFDFWMDQHARGLPLQGAANVLDSIANAIAASAEARSLFPLLAHPEEASADRIGAFVDGVYGNLFSRAADPEGRSYWMDQVRQALADGRLLGSVVVDIVGGTRDSDVANDVTMLMGKVALGLEYVHRQQLDGPGSTDLATARSLFDALTEDPQTLLGSIDDMRSLWSSVTSRPGSGEWNAPGTWREDRVPGKADTVIIDRAIVSLAGSGFAADVVSYGRLDIDGTLEAREASLQGFLDLGSSGRLILEKSLSNQLGVELRSSGLIDAGSVMNISNRFFLDVGSELRTGRLSNAGSMFVDGTVEVGGALDNRSGAKIYVVDGSLVVKGLVTNNGMVEAVFSDSAMSFDGGYDGGGGRGTVTLHGGLTIKGAATGGSVHLQELGHLSLLGSATSASDLEVRFASGSQSLALSHSSNFQGAIGSFGADDSIDVLDVQFESPAFATSYDPGTRQLTLTDGTHTARLRFLEPQQGFGFQGDGHGGTLVSLAPATGAALPLVGLAETPDGPT